MQPQKKESVYGFLTPKRMLSSLMRPSPNKSKINRSMTSDDVASQPNLPSGREGQAEIPSASHSRQIDSYKKKPVSQDPYFVLQTSSDNQIPSAKWGDDKSDAVKVYNDREGGNSRISKASRNSGITDNQNPQTRVDRFGTTKNPAEQSTPEIPSGRKFKNSKTNPDIYRLSIQETLNKLTKLKDSLEQQISGLKKLLDQTSASLESMDAEYEKFKQKILFFVSRSLDSAFKEYKKNLPNWAIYETVQEKGLTRIAEINQAVEVCQNQEMLRHFGGKEEMQKLIDQCKVTVLEVKDAKEQCFAQRPMITQQKIKKLQNVLKQIGQF